MRVLFASTSDCQGGAARATYKLAEGLRADAVDIEMQVQVKTLNNSWIRSRNRGLVGGLNQAIKPLIDSAPLKFYSNRRESSWSLNLTPSHHTSKIISSKEFDIVNLHSIGDGFVPISSLRKINRPIVWSLYDMWPMTGGCHYAGACTLYKSHCHGCPQLRSSIPDISTLVHCIKKSSWQSLQIDVVSPSTWLAKAASESSLFSESTIHIVPHGINLQLFKPHDRYYSRKFIGLEQEKKYILFGAMGGLSDKRKGYQYLQIALSRLSREEDLCDVELIVFGSNGPDTTEQVDIGMPVRFIGRINDDISLALLYSSVDLVVTPSTQEAFGMTASEAMACGTPAVAFDISGPKDVIDHKVNGFLAKALDPEDLAYGIKWVLNHPERGSIETAAHEKCRAKFDIRDVAKSYRLIYEEAVHKYAIRQD